MTYPKQVVLIINHSKEDRQIKRITFQTLEEHREYIQNLDTNQQLIEDEEDEPLSPSQLLRNVFSDIGQAYKDGGL